MTLYVCLDDRDGMLFNNRRQSRDRAVLEDIRASVPDVLSISPFSEKLVREAGIPYALVSEDLPENAHFFLENGDSAALAARASGVVVYRWNRRYPADVRFGGDLSRFSLESKTEFPGHSHEIITKEVYVL